MIGLYRKFISNYPVSVQHQAHQRLEQGAAHEIPDVYHTVCCCNETVRLAFSNVSVVGYIRTTEKTHYEKQRIKNPDRY